MTLRYWAAALAILSALLQVPLLVTTIRDNDGIIDGGDAWSEPGPDRGTDIAVIAAFLGIACAVGAAALSLI